MRKRKATEVRTGRVVGDGSDFPEGSHKVVKVGRREVGVFNSAGRLCGVPNLCPHQTGPLCEGKTTGTLIVRKERARSSPARGSNVAAVGSEQGRTE